MSAHDASHIAADGCRPTVQWYRHAHAKDMPLRAIARLIQTMLYAQRFFPYYVYNILGGIEEDGTSITPCVTPPNADLPFRYWCRLLI